MTSPASRSPVRDEPLRLPLRIAGVVVLAIMAAALAYTAYISLANWSSIAV
jgi:hypothetical protein